MGKEKPEIELKPRKQLSERFGGLWVCTNMYSIFL